MSMKYNIRFLLAIFLLTVTYSLHRQQLRSDESVRDQSGAMSKDRRNWQISTKRPMETRKNATPSFQPLTVSMDWEDLLTCTDNSSTELPVTSEVANDTADLELCSDLPPNLGRVGSGKSMINIASIQSIYNELKIGGAFKGKQCKARQAVAIIVPYKGEKKNLSPFLYFMHPFLMKQQLEYRIFVIQFTNTTSSELNRGQLFNIGAMEAERFRPGGWDCLILHDADLLPLDLRNLYRCSWFPRRMVWAMSKPSMKKLDERLHDGVISITPELYKMTNGFSNQIMDRDFCYKDFYSRLNLTNLILEDNNKLVGIYRTMKYVNRTLFNGVLGSRNKISSTPTASIPKEDGMNSTAYVVDSIKELFFYTSINVTAYPSFAKMAEVLDARDNIKNKTMSNNSFEKNPNFVRGHDDFLY